jgi:ubiquinone/menaquinone biosynthesis C-methylase UbiE
MLERAREKVSEAGVTGVTFCHAGFLTFERPAESVQAMASTFSFHHLPDFWKGIALKRMNRMLIPGGRLYLRDVIIQESQAMENVSRLIEEQARLGGDFLRDDAEGHFREEYSTYEWVMDGLLARAGFHTIEKRMEEGVIGTYLCEKIESGVRL